MVEGQVERSRLRKKEEEEKKKRRRRSSGRRSDEWYRWYSSPSQLGVFG